MKILIAYDGTESSDAMIDELPRAGLPAEAGATVFSVADVWVPPPADNEILDDAFPLQIPAGLKWSRRRAAEMLEESDEIARRGAERLRQLFPGWKTINDAIGGAPAAALLKYADEQQPDLIVVGAHNHTELRKIFLGSVSQKVLAGAQQNVRVARRTSGAGTSAQRVVLAYDGSEGAKAALRAVAARNWSPGSEIRVIVAGEPMKANPIARLVPPVNEFVNEINDDVSSETEKTAAEAVETLRATFGADQNITVSPLFLTGKDAADLIVRHAANFGADSIFTGANRFNNRLERWLLGSVSAAIAERADCSVEVVRAAQSAENG